MWVILVHHKKDKTLSVYSVSVKGKTVSRESLLKTGTFQEVYDYINENVLTIYKNEFED